MLRIRRLSGIQVGRVDFIADYREETVRIFNTAGYWMWFLEKESTDGKYVVKPLKYQPPFHHSLTTKNILVISMREIWKDDVLFARVKEAWSVTVIDNKADVEEEKWADAGSIVRRIRV